MNCITIDDEPLAHKVIKNYCDNLPFLNIVKECHSAIEGIDYLNKNQIDLIFLDINMPKLKGLDFLRTLSNPPLVIVTTAYQEYAIESYELNIIDYLLKPFSFERFLKAVNKAQEQIKMRKLSLQKDIKNQPLLNTVIAPDNDTIFVKGDKKTHQIPLKSILYLEGLGSYVKIHLENETIITLDRLANFENTLPKNLFLRVHRSYIVALKKIQTIEGNKLKIGEVNIPMGSTYKHSLKNIIK